MSRFRRLIENKTYTPLQILKYSFAGVLAAATHVAVFTTLNETLLPANLGQPDFERGFNFFIANTLSFALANIVAYGLNFAWVFQSGRHARWKEIIYFFLISGASYLAVTPLGSMIVGTTHVNEYFAFGLVLLLSVIANFVGRKYWVFLH